MVSRIALTLFLGKPLVMYGGLTTFFLLIFTAMVGALNYRGIRVIPFKLHPYLALITIIAATMHGLMGLSILFNF